MCNKMDYKDEGHTRNETLVSFVILCKRPMNYRRLCAITERMRQSFVRADPNVDKSVGVSRLDNETVMYTH